MKALKLTLGVLVVLLAIFLILASFLPKTSQTERKILIKASENQIFSTLNNIKEFEKWSSFTNDTTAIITYNDKQSGVGAKMFWKGEHENGSQEIVESYPDSLIVFKIDFADRGSAFSIFQIVTTPNGAELHWRFKLVDLSWPFGRYFGLFNDKMMKPYMEKGLANIKKLCESMKYSNIESHDDIIFKKLDKRYVLIINKNINYSNISNDLKPVFDKLLAYALNHSLTVIGNCFVSFKKIQPNGNSNIEVGIPVSRTIKVQKPFEFKELPATNVVCLSHRGNIKDGLKRHELIKKFIRESKLTENGNPWEEYKIGFLDEKDSAKWETIICYPVK